MGSVTTPNLDVAINHILSKRYYNIFDLLFMNFKFGKLFMNATLNEYTSLLKNLVYAGIPCISLLMTAIRQGKNNAVKAFFEADMDINLIDRHGYTPLMVAVTFNNKEIITYLASNPRINFTIRNDHNDTVYDIVNLIRDNETRILYDRLLKINVIDVFRSQVKHNINSRFFMNHDCGLPRDVANMIDDYIHLSPNK